MSTLYDLLGALPHDDAEGLRAAFRRAVKGAHPDLRPGDPDAALKFREIVRANEILGDAEQRAAYDDLLELARLEQAPGRAIAARIHRLASGVIAVAGASVVMTVGGYLLFMHMSVASVAPASNIDVVLRVLPEIAAASRAALPDQADTTAAPANAPPATREGTVIPAGTDAPGDALPRTDTARVTATHAGPAPALDASEARFLHAPAISFSRDGDPTSSLVSLDPAGRFDPKFLPAYADREIIFYRLRRFDRAFADIAPAKPTEKPRRARSAATAGKPRFDQAAIAPSVTPLLLRSPATQDPSRQESIVLVRAR
jgi:curved DNA-binding protein CbpA